jgi:hypothetical protein
MKSIKQLSQFAALLMFFTMPGRATEAAAAAKVKVGLIDTGLCRIDKPWVGVNYQFNPLFKSFPVVKNPKPVMPPPQTPACSEIQKSTQFQRSYHAYYVLDTLMKELARLKVEFEIELFPVQVFNPQGETDGPSWQVALEHLKNKKIDLLILASGLIDASADFRLELPALTFAAAATGGPGINKETRFWPQNFHAQLPQLIIVGQYAPTSSDNLALNKVRQGQIDPEILLPENVGFLAEPVPVNSRLTGSSYSTPIIAARYIAKCGPSAKPQDCLNTHTELKEGRYFLFGAVEKRKNYRVFK